MTEIKARRDGARAELLIKNHATGNHDACTAISTLVCTLANYLTYYGHETEVLDVREGFVEIRYEGDEQSLAVFDAIALGLLAVAEESPEAVTFTED